MKLTTLKHGLFWVYLLGFCMSAEAYVGPGAGLSAIGTFLAMLFAVLVAVLGFFWYPMKRMISRLRGEPLVCKEGDDGDVDGDGDEDEDGDGDDR